MNKLDRYDLLLIDDLGYVKKSEAETSVLFELIAHRYERKSLLITANQPFSQWDSIFTDSMMTVAAIDRARPSCDNYRGSSPELSSTSCDGTS